MKFPRAQGLRIAILLLGLALGAGPALASGQAEKSQLTLIGVLSVRGNMPFTYLSLATTQHVWRLTGPQVVALQAYQNQVAKLVVEVETPPHPGHLTPPVARVLQWKILKPSETPQ